MQIASRNSNDDDGRTEDGERGAGASAKWNFIRRRRRRKTNLTLPSGVRSATPKGNERSGGTVGCRFKITNGATEGRTERQWVAHAPLSAAAALCRAGALTGLFIYANAEPKREGVADRHRDTQFRAILNREKSPVT